MPSSLPNCFVSLSTLQQHWRSPMATGRRWREHQLRRQVKTAGFKLGIHCLLISSAKAKQQSYLWNPAAIQELWSSDPALRKTAPGKGP